MIGPNLAAVNSSAPLSSMSDWGYSNTNYHSSRNTPLLWPAGATSPQTSPYNSSSWNLPPSASQGCLFLHLLIQTLQDLWTKQPFYKCSLHVCMSVVVFHAWKGPSKSAVSHSDCAGPSAAGENQCFAQATQQSLCTALPRKALLFTAWDRLLLSKNELL